MGVRSRANCIAHGGEKLLHRSNQNAQALVELALLLPILLVLIVGALEFGRLWSTKIILTNAAREGAYYLSTHSTETYCSSNGTYIISSNAVQASENEATSSGVALTSGDVVILGPSCDAGSTVKVTVSTTVDNLLILGFAGSVFHLTGTTDSITLSSSVEMMIQ